jgi:hypothetical protein
MGGDKGNSRMTFPAFLAVLCDGAFNRLPVGVKFRVRGLERGMTD